MLFVLIAVWLKRHGHSSREKSLTAPEAQEKTKDKTKTASVGLVPFLLILIVVLVVLATVPMATVTVEEPYTTDETYWEPYIVRVPLTDEEIDAWYAKYGKPAKMVNIDDLSGSEILAAWSRRPELTKPLPEYKEVEKSRRVTREVLKLREVSKKVTILEYLTGGS